jgi:hypothetical protein
MMNMGRGMARKAISTMGRLVGCVIVQFLSR